MKKIFLVFSIFLSVITNAQDTLSKKEKTKEMVFLHNEEYKPYGHDSLYLKHSAGFELQIASKNYFTGFGLVIGGTGAVFLGAALAKSFDEPKASLPFTIIGCLAALTGSVFIIESHIHLKRAGIILDKNGISLTIKLK